MYSTGESERSLKSASILQNGSRAETETPHRQSRLLLPREPLYLIEAGEARLAFNFRELWTYRELLYFLMWRDIKVRYKQTLLGAAWAIVQPLFAMLIFTLFFGKLAGVPSDNVPYPLFAYAGLLPWTFFANAVTNSSNSLIGSSNLITKVYFPRVLVPMAAVGAGLIDFAIAFVILFALMLYYDVNLTWNIASLPLLILQVTLIALSIGTLLSALNVKYRDIRHALPFAIQLWMFASPVIYPLSIMPERWRWTLAINPMTGIIEAFRSCLFGRGFNWSVIAISWAATFALLLFSAYIFRRIEENFADII